MGIFKKNLNEEDFEKTINLLKGLNKINAPDDFEYKLMVKITNQDFSSVAKETRGLKFMWALPPAAAVLLTTVVLVFILNDKVIEIESPLFSPPTLRAEYQTQAKKEVKSGPVEYYAKETDESIVSAGKSMALGVSSNNANTSKSENFKVVLQPNDVIVTEKLDYPFDEDNSVNLDSYIQGSGQSRNENSAAHLARDGDVPVFDFNGFYIREQIDKKTLQSSKNKTDSLSRFTGKKLK